MRRPDHIKSSASSSEALTQDQYAAQMKQLDAEALYTFAAAILVTLVFWLAIFLTHDSSVTIFHLPLWFVLSCLGGYVFSVVCVVLLVKLFLKSMTLKVPSVKHSSTDKSEADLAAYSGANAAHDKSTAANTTEGGR